MASSPAASAAMALPPSAAPALDFEQLLARDLPDHRPATVTQMIPREKFVKDTSSNNNNNTTKKALLAAQDASATDPVMEGHVEASSAGAVSQQTNSTANKLVRALVATTPAFVSRLEAQHAEVAEENKDANYNWKTSLANRTKALLEELTGSSPTDTPQLLLLDQQDYNNSHKGRFDSKLHEVEMSNWENKIEWQGLQDTTNTSSGNKDDTTHTTTNNTGSQNNGNGSSSNNNGGNNNSNGANNSTAVEKTSQPTDPMQLLMQRRNHWLDTLDFDNTVNWEGVDSTRKLAPIPLLLELGVAGQSVARHVFPCSRPPTGAQSAEYQERMERERDPGAQITREADVTKGGSLHADREKMEALIEARQKKRAQMAKDKTNRVTEAMGTLAMGPGKGRTITSSLMGPGGTERTGRPSRHNVGTTSAHELEYMDQLDMVSNHALVRDLSKVSLREYHRPKLPRNVVRTTLQWQFQLRYMGSSSDKPSVPGGRGSTSYQSIMMGTHPGAMSKAKLRSEADLSVSEGKLVLMEYCEERPPIQMTKGMAFKIVNYFRGDKQHCPVSRGGGDRPTRKKKRSENESPSKVNRNTSKNILGDRPPRLEGPDKALKATASDWIGKIPKKTRDGDAAAKNTMVDMMPEGITEMLHPKVHGPFVGEVDEGMIISGLISLLFVAPLFRQEPESTDFLMILGRPTGGGIARPGVTEALGVMLRDFPSSVYTVGQTEPRARVYAPNTQGWKNFLGPFVSYQIAKLLARVQSREGHGLRFDEIQERVLPNLEQQTNALRQRLKQVAIYDKNTQIWTTKAIGYEEYPGVDALGKSIAPEGVACFETASAAARRLKDLGLNQLFEGSHSVGSVGITMIYLAGQVNAAKELHRKAKKMYELSRTNKALKPSQVMFYEKAAAQLELQWKCLRQKHDVCKFIYEELQLTPWHLTGEFIEVHKKGEGSGMMKLTGLGDPSGLGEGFSFLREADAKPSKAPTGALDAQMKKITGTEDDLRKLTMKQMAALLRKFGMAQKKIDTLKRWDRVHVIRDLSTRNASDGMGDGLERFARGEKMKLSEQKQVYRKRIQVIWKRQIAALSSSADGGGAAGDAGAGGPDAAGAATADAEADPSGGPSATNKAAQKKQDKKEDSESDSDDDDFAATFEEEMMDRSEANQLVAAHARGDGEERTVDHGQLRAAVQDQDLAKDARELAAIRRQREEERAAREGLASVGKKDSGPAAEINLTGVVPNRKVIRKKVVKTFPDGRQTTTFKFIVRPDEVGSLMAKIAEKEKKEGPEKHNKYELIKYERSSNERPIGHSMFEDEDDFDYSSTHGRRGTRSRRGGRRGGRTGTPTGAKRGPKPRTLQLGKLKTKVSKEQRIKKRKREEEEADLYTTASKRKGTSNRRERGSIRDRRPHVIFAERLEAIRAMVESRPQCGPFVKPVNRRQLPRYYEVISNPIDLATIRDKNQRYEYRTADAFVKDFELMKNNAIKFNGAGTMISDEAVNIYEAVKEQVEANRTELTEMEETVKEQFKPKKKKKKKTGKKKSSAGSDDGGTMGFVGGVEVNLGDLNTLRLDDVGSDDEESAAGLIDFG